MRARVCARMRACARAPGVRACVRACDCSLEDLPLIGCHRIEICRTEADGQAGGRTDGPMDRRTDGRIDVPAFMRACVHAHICMHVLCACMHGLHACMAAHVCVA